MAPGSGGATVTIIDDGRVSEVDGAVVGGHVVVATGALPAAIGFERKPEGLCKGEVCVPVRPGGGLEADGGIDVTRLAEVLGRPVVVEEELGVAYLGPPSAERAGALRSLQAPDFSLPDLDGTLHSLSEHRGSKVLLAAYASW